MERIEIEVLAGEHIRTVIERAVLLANETGKSIGFTFNMEEHRVRPGEDYEQAKARIAKKHGTEILEPEEEAAKLKAEREGRERAFQEAIAITGDLDEAGMRASMVPTFGSLDELREYINSLVERPHDYGTSVYAMSMAAVAAFNYVGGRLAVSGFQASCADMDILRRTRGYKDGFQVIDYSNMLYPQYWDDQTRPIFAAILRRDSEARKRIKEKAGTLLKRQVSAAPEVERHWRWLAGLDGQPQGQGAYLLDPTRHIQRLAEERDKFRDQVRDTCRRAEKAEAACQKAVDVIYRVESRCMATDGPVTPTLEEMSEQELRELYLALAEIVDKDNFARLTGEDTGKPA